MASVKSASQLCCWLYVRTDELTQEANTYMSDSTTVKPPEKTLTEIIPTLQKLPPEQREVREDELRQTQSDVDKAEAEEQSENKK